MKTPSVGAWRTILLALRAQIPTFEVVLVGTLQGDRDPDRGDHSCRKPSASKFPP
jgi:hypothetical protein